MSERIQNNPLPQSGTAKTSTQKQTIKNYIDIFKDYFNKNIQFGKANYHDVSISDVKDTAEQLYNQLIQSGAKVVQYDKERKIIKFNNGIEFYYQANNQKANIQIWQEFEDGTLYHGHIKTDESINGIDYNEIAIQDGVNKSDGTLLRYSSQIENDNNGSHQAETKDKQINQNGAWYLKTETREQDSN